MVQMDFSPKNRTTSNSTKKNDNHLIATSFSGRRLASRSFAVPRFERQFYFSDGLIAIWVLNREFWLSNISTITIEQHAIRTPLVYFRLDLGCKACHDRKRPQESIAAMRCTLIRRFKIEPQSPPRSSWAALMRSSEVVRWWWHRTCKA